MELEKEVVGILIKYSSSLSLCPPSNVDSLICHYPEIIYGAEQNTGVDLSQTAALWFTFHHFLIVYFCIFRFGSGNFRFMTSFGKSD